MYRSRLHLRRSVNPVPITCHHDWLRQIGKKFSFFFQELRVALAVFTCMESLSPGNESFPFAKRGVARRWHRRARAAMALLILLLMVTGCRPKTQPSPKAGQVFSGIVTDQENNPVANARVEVSGQETLSKNDGAFQLSVPGAEKYVLNFSHPDFAEFSFVSRPSSSTFASSGSGVFKLKSSRQARSTSRAG